ncbi:hypothetical protein P4S72_03500 [Vibrio sp. PP-XX7]
MLASVKPTSDATYRLTNTQVIPGCIEILEQGVQFLASINDEQYTYAAPPHVTSSIGEHFRHLIDLFQAIYQADHVIDYNYRRRGHAVETSRHLALNEIAELIQWLQQYNETDLKTPVHLLTEVSLTQTHACEMTSTLERELTFAALHATHHFAMTKVTISLCQIEVSDTFGYAPTTASYLRGQ